MNHVVTLAEARVLAICAILAGLWYVGCLPSLEPTTAAMTWDIGISAGNAARKTAAVSLQPALSETVGKMNAVLSSTGSTPPPGPAPDGMV